MLEGAASPAAQAGARRRFTTAYLIGAALSLFVYLWLVTGGTWHLFRWEQAGDFFDVQAHALLHGHLWMPRDVLDGEGFTGRGGHSYMHWGPFPALLRLPFAAVGDETDGRLAVVSMLCAYGLTLAAAARIAWLVRGLVRPGARLGRAEFAATAGLSVAVGIGSSVLFLGSRAWVYHEALAWGLAAALLAYAGLLEFVKSPRRAPLAWATVWSMAAMLSRPELGTGVVVALALLAAGTAAWTRKRRRPKRSPTPWLAARGRPAGGSWWPVLAAAAALPLFTYMLVNWAKFGLLLGVPEGNNRLAVIDPGFREAVGRNGGSLFGAQFVPTNLLAYLRPDGIRLRSLFPWIDFPADHAVVGGVRFASLGNTASMPASMPVWVLLAVRGAVEVVQPRASAPTNASLLRLPLVGALAATAPVLASGRLEERYTAGLFPVLLLAGVAGAHALLRRADAGHDRAVSRASSWAVGALVGFATLCTCWIMLGLALLTQRLYSPRSPRETETLIDVQRALNARVPGHGPIAVTVGRAMPPWGRHAELFVVGDCAGLYVSTGAKPTSVLARTNWTPVERTSAVGDRRFTVRIASRPPGTAEPLVDFGSPVHPATLKVVHRGGDALAFTVKGPATLPATGRPVHLGGGPHTLEVAADQRVGVLDVRVDGRPVLSAFYGGPNGTADPNLDSVRPASAGPSPQGDSRSVVPIADAPPSLCLSLLAQSGRSSAKQAGRSTPGLEPLELGHHGSNSDP